MARRATSQIGPSGHPPPSVPRTTSPRPEMRILKPGLASVEPSVFVTVATANASRRDASSFRRSVYSGVFTKRRARPRAIYLSPDSAGRRQEDKPSPLPRDVASRGRRKGVRRVSPVPFGLGFTKPHNYREVFRSAWNNKHRPLFTWRILRDGVCDGCALGTTGLRDFTMEGIHLCTVRLDLLPLNTMGPLRIRRLEDAKALRSKSSQELRDLGRLRSPMFPPGGTPGFRRAPGDAGFQFGAGQFRATSPDRLGFFVPSRGMTKTESGSGLVARICPAAN